MSDSFDAKSVVGGGHLTAAGGYTMSNTHDRFVIKTADINRVTGSIDIHQLIPEPINDVGPSLTFVSEFDSDEAKTEESLRELSERVHLRLAD